MAFKFFISTAELAEFKVWLKECCGMDFDSLSDHQKWRCYSSWQDELFHLANPDCNPDYFV